MDELMIYEYLKNKTMEDKEFLDKFKSFMDKNKHIGHQEFYPYKEDWDFEVHNPSEKHHSDIGSFSKDHDTIYKYKGYNLSHNPLTEEEAKHIVSYMYHIENNKKYIGEKYDMYKTKEMCQRYKSYMPSHVSIPEMYVAINAQYHNYAELFNKWFGDNADSKIIESAIVFWFKDNNYKSTNKVSEYFRD